MKPISVQLYTVREEAAKDFPGVLKQIAEMGYVGVEFAGLHDMCPKEVRSIIDDLGLKVSSAHMAMPNPDNAAALIDECQTLGIPRLISGFGPDQLGTLDGCLAAKDSLASAAAILADSGLTFGIHNHWWEFDHQFDGVYPEDILLSADPSIFAELDVYWVTCGGADPAEQVARLSDRVPLLHIKDGMVDPQQPHTAVGAGVLDMPAIIGAADESILEWVIVELDSCGTCMMGAVADSYKYLVGAGLAQGNKPAGCGCCCS